MDIGCKRRLAKLLHTQMSWDPKNIDSKPDGYGRRSILMRFSDLKDMGRFAAL